MKLIRFRPDLFYHDPIMTERVAAQLMRLGNIDADVAYYAIPWVVLINLGQLSLLNRLGASTSGITVCQHCDLYRAVPTFKRLGIKTVFSPHASNADLGIDIMPFPHFAVNGAVVASQKDILYSFIGCVTHASREALFSLPIDPRAVMIERERWHFQNHPELKRKCAGEYRDILARSRFSLCPRGSGIGTVRFWESLQSGAIPVLISDGLKLPSMFDWSLCCIRVPEMDIVKIPEMIASIDDQRELRMRVACLDAFRAFSGMNLVSVIRHYLCQPMAE